MTRLMLIIAVVATLGCRNVAPKVDYPADHLVDPVTDRVPNVRVVR